MSNAATKTFEFTKQEQKVKPQGLMTKLSKSNLLRLLSILEGELEAQDIFITDLQTRISRERLVQGRYFQHSLSDPFLALLRDGEALKDGTSTNKDRSKQNNIEPLPLLEKVVAECKRQQLKVRQHLALSDAYYKLANQELIEVKRKHAADAAVGDDVTAALEKEREKLQLEIRVERARANKSESKYGQLLRAVNNERKRFHLITTMLLKERYERFSKPPDFDNLSIDELKDSYEQLLLKNQTLESQMEELKERESNLKESVNQLTSQLSQLRHQSSIPDPSNEAQPMGKSPAGLPSADHSRRSTTSLEDAAADDVFRNSSQESVNVRASSGEANRGKERIPTLPPTPHPAYSAHNSSAVTSDFACLPDKTSLSLKLTTSGTVTSPTSGASSFALNSPNITPTVSSFATPALPAKVRKSNSSVSSTFQSSRQKFQRFSSPMPSPPSTNKSEVHHPTRHMKNTPDPVPPSPLSDPTFPSVQSSTRMDGNPLHRRSLDSNGTPHMPQPPKPPKLSNNAKLSKEDVKGAIKVVCPPPLPPKKPSLLGKPNSAKISAARTTKDSDNNKSDHQHRHPGDNKQQRPTTPTRSSNTASNILSTSAKAKRPSSLNTNNNNNNRVAARTSSASFSRQSLSAQQRLFPPQGSSDGQLLSPVTKTVPKSPLESCMFTFK